MLAALENTGEAFKTSTPVSNSAWIIDLGTTNHMTFDSEQVSNLKPSSQKTLSVADGTSY